jgi:NAD(P) transhydrogenase subunit alpha
MALTTAISSIAVVGAIIIAGQAHDTLSTVLGAVAVFASTTNLVSGYLITDRMLRMFKRREAPKS